MAYRSLSAETVSFVGHNGDRGDAYVARPASAGPVPGVVVIHHMPGWDEWTTEVVRKLAHHGFAAIAPSLYFRLGDGSAPEVVARARAEGGMADDQVVGDVAGSAAWLRAQPGASGKVGVIGFCAGGRQAYLAACRLGDLDAAVDCWGGNVVVDEPAKLDARHPVAPIDLTERLRCPLLGIFGNDDTNPSPAHVDHIEAELRRLGKVFEVHRYDGAGHGFFAWYRPNYRAEQATDGWDKVLAFLGRHLS